MIVDRCVTSYGAVNVTDADRATAWDRGIPLWRACEERVAQDYANRSRQVYSDYYQKPREMTAEDLGLPLVQWSDEWLTSIYGCCRPHLWMWMAAWPKSLPSYAFWLGAEAA